MKKLIFKLLFDNAFARLMKKYPITSCYATIILGGLFLGYDISDMMKNNYICSQNSHLFVLHFIITLYVTGCLAY